jgi:predicted PurR-regulated permease PerM
MEIRSISSAATLKVTALVLGVVVAFRFLWIAHAIFVVTFLGVLLGLAMAKAVDYLERLHVKRGIGAPLVLITILAICTGIGVMIGPSIQEQTRQLTTELPKAMREVEGWVNRTPAKALVTAQPAPQPTAQQGQKPQQQQQQGRLTAQVGRELRNASKFLFPIISSALGAIGGLIIVLFLAMYIAADPGLYREGLLHLVPHRHRDRARDVLAALRDTLRQWLIARLMAMVIIGIVTGGGLALLGVKGAAALGVLAGILEFVPFFGPVISAIPAIGIALVDSPQKALWVIGLYILVQQLEGNVVTPLLLEKRLDVPPVLTVVVVAALGVVFGVIGMLIAEPLLAAILVTTKMLYVQDVVGDDVSIGKAGG